MLNPKGFIRRITVVVLGIRRIWNQRIKKYSRNHRAAYPILGQDGPLHFLPKPHLLSILEPVSAAITTTISNSLSLKTIYVRSISCSKLFDT